MITERRDFKLAMKGANLSFLDDPPVFTGDALAELRRMTPNAAGKISHDVVPGHCRAECYDDDGRITSGRNIDFTVQLLITAIKQLDDRITALEAIVRSKKT
jgi:hypothetical protein